MTAYPKRLIEVDLPIARISTHARREKSIRHGHISTLHIWWARRPLAACRAVICASLWPDPADELCPPAFREAAATNLMAFARRVFPEKITEEGRQLASEKHLSPESRGRWERLLQSEKDGLPLDPTDAAHQQVLQGALLDFIADFANWDNSTVPAYLETSRALTQAAHEALGGMPGTRPLVVDPFAGGGAIPLEALRIGADPFGSDINPVATLLNRVLLEVIPKHGTNLSERVLEWGKYIKEQATEELSKYYPPDKDGSIPIAYLWSRTIKCEGPSCGYRIPLIRSPWVAKKGAKRVGVRLIPNNETLDFDIEVVHNAKESDLCKGTVQRGSANCPRCGYTTPVASVRNQLQLCQGGAKDSQLLCVVIVSSGSQGRTYRSPSKQDYKIAESAAEYLESNRNSLGEYLPNEPLPPDGALGYRIQKYGMMNWQDVFTPRQLLALATLSRLCRTVEVSDPELKLAVSTLLSFALSRTQDLNASTSTWANTIEAVCGANRAQNRMPMVWDYVEPVPIGDFGGNWLGQVEWIVRVVEHVALSVVNSGNAQQGCAQEMVLPSNSANAIVTDPPYYDAFGYSDLSDFFLVWLKRSLPESIVAGFKLSETGTSPKNNEIVVNPGAEKDGRGPKGHAWFEEQMAMALAEGRRIAKPDGIGVIVFANKSTSGWESLLDAIVSSGWTVTGSWPIDTERPNRQRAQDSAALTSSVHLVCRPRENHNGSLREETGEWRDVLSELPKRIHEWMPRLAAEGVVGADAIFACLGPALEVFSRYSRVEKASGEAVPLREYLEQVWATVSTEALSMIFKDADAAGLEPDARLTAMWLWTLGGMETNGSESKSSSDRDEKVVASKGYTLEYDAARKIAQGLGVHLEQSDSIVEVSGDKARLLPVSERTRHLFGKDEATTTPRAMKKKAKAKQLDLFKTLDEIEAEAEQTAAGELKPQAGETVLDRVHQSMILFASGRGEALRRFLVDDGAGNDARFWKLAQSLSALYPKETDEKRWVDGVLARKKGLGL
ncbi:DUF1156 domain-containing protein [uncultured Rubinisphaera sp.]|uniref:DUF1156 domain-containing protein n=1 Tax=uncultured Rubinisphaera sp. TaxID=1678686 RepID=UPI0030D9E8F6